MTAAEEFENRAERLKFFASCIPVGGDRGIKGKELKILWHVSGRELRLIIAALRREPCDGFALCAGNSGYYWSNSPSEIRKWLCRSRSHLKRFRDELVEAEKLLYELEAGAYGEAADV